jgi:hypothetical protein
MRIIYALIVGTVVSLTSLAIAQTDQLPPDQVTPDQVTPEQFSPEQLTPEQIIEQQRQGEEAAAAGCAACGGSMVVMLIVLVVAIALNIALLIWVARDAKSRAMDSSVLWMILVMFTGPIGLIIYIFSRPQGQLSQCSSCNGKRLSASAKCPHCQNP